MKKINRYFLIVLCVGSFLFMGANFNGNVFTVDTTFKAGYDKLRTEANEDASLLDLATSGSFADKPAGAKKIGRDLNTKANAVSLSFMAGSAQDKTFGWRLYGWRHANGPATLIAYGTGLTGSQAVGAYPDTGQTATNIYWADTIAITSSCWLKTVSAINVGNNNVAQLAFDLCGYEYLYCQITAADGVTGDEAGDVSVWYSFF